MHKPESGRNRENLDPKGHFDEASVREGYELTDANTGGIMVFLVALFISVGVFFLVCFGFGIIINNGLNHQDGPVDKWNAPNQIAPRKAIQSNPALEQEQLARLTRQFPTPRLELDDGNQDLTELHGREDLLLDHYTWVDKPGGAVRIPIDRAMELIAQRGLPVAPDTQHQTMMIGDSQPHVQMPLTNGFARTGYEQELHGGPAQAGEQASTKADNQ
ncbi:MAG TPA: hypothetical protein VHZ25_07180 [Acidobacteriaceae bacterium]|jgi:hypothetical protein|nr:hypothetical protein [Acidobacteriaceae bacterium]